MTLTRRRVLKDLSLVGAAVGLSGCGPDAPPQSPPAGGPATHPVAAQSGKPIRLAIEGVIVLRPTKTSGSVTQVDVALMSHRANESLQLPTHYPTLSVPRALIAGYNLSPVSSDSTYMHWSLDGYRIKTTVVAGAATYSPGGKSKIEWNDDERDVTMCPDTQEVYRSLAWVPHFSEIKQKLGAGWDDQARSATVVSLAFGSFEDPTLPLTLSEEFDQARWIFTRSRDNDSLYKDGDGKPQGRALKNVVTAALSSFDSLTFDFVAADGSKGYLKVGSQPSEHSRFDPELQPIRLSNLSGPHHGVVSLHDFLAYYELSGAADVRDRYYPTSRIKCDETIECGCCPPSIADN